MRLDQFSSLIYKKELYNNPSKFSSIEYYKYPSLSSIILTMFKVLALAALSVASLAQYGPAGFSLGVNSGDLRAVNRINEI